MDNMLLLERYRGIEVADKIVNSKTDYNDRPYEDQVMEKVTVDTFGVEYPEPEKM
jgi:peptidyl-prolyl cis-trans isomerase B (cyclophilin B)